MSNILEPGKYLATVEDFGIGTSAEKGTPFLNVKFKIKDTGVNAYWQQYLTANTIERVTKNLVETSLLKTKKFSDLAEGHAGGGLSLEQEVELVIVHETYNGANGEIKTAVKVQFVNVIGGGAMKNVLAKAEAITALAGLNLDAEILAAEQRTGVQVNTQKAAPAVVADEDIPF